MPPQSSNAASEQLIAMIRRREWKTVRSRLLLLSPSSTGANGCVVHHNLSTPLHMACLYRAPHDIIRLLVHGFPQALFVQDTQGWTPLHVNLLYGTDETTTLFLIRAGGPTAAGLTCKLVGSPLHLACRHGSSETVLQALLKERPDMVACSTAGGLLPANLLSKSFYRLSKQQRHYNTSSSTSGTSSAATAVQDGEKKLVRQLDMFLRAFQQSTRRTHSSLDCSCLVDRPHVRDMVAFQIGCATQTNYLQLSQRHYPAQTAADLRDYQMGPLPLHVAAQYPAAAQQSSLQQLDPLQWLLQAHSAAAAVPDAWQQGRLALHTAISVGKRHWATGVEALLAAEPAACQERDPVTGLRPFQLAAVTLLATQQGGSEAESVDTIFRLLLACPHVSERERRT